MKKIFEEIDKLQEEINKHRPLNPELIKQIKEYYRIGLTYSSNALEGNSITETETKIILEEGITIGGKTLREHYETVGHGESHNLMLKMAESSDKFKFTEDAIKELHDLFYYRINKSYAGKYREVPIIVTGSKHKFPNPDDVPNLMEKFINNLEKLCEKKHPVECVALIHKEFIYIHPFVDGNGRVARLIMNLALVNKGFPIAIIPPITRNQYIGTLAKAYKDDSYFIEFIASMVKETQKDYLRIIG